ncbi:MFS transporter [Catellatospora paridis]|uniref:MFS transporter n=1 Tax=Catellatospora paridis TaxID=1617086 RepID=UPI0018B01214|nr:MFS transporter [Catellatospora paridis]
MVASFLGALPIGMLGLGVLLLAHSTTGSFAAAGSVSGAFSIGNAVGLVTQGRLIDRYGQTRVLVVGGLLCPAALVAFIAASSTHAPLLVSAMLAAGGGASLPATTSSMRVLWPRLVRDPAQRSTAYAVLATQFQIAMVAGPLLVSALVLVGGPAGAVLVAAGFACCGGLAFAAAPASRRSRLAADAPAAVPRGRLGAGMWTLLVAGFGGGVAGGMMTVSVPAVAAEHESAALAGLLFAALSAGELLGGLIYGGVAWRLPPARRLVVGQAAAALGMAALVLLTGTPAGMLVAMFAVGACLAPIAIASSALLDDIAPPGSLARAYTVLVAVGLLGVAAGSAVGGALGTSLGTRPVLLIASSALGVVASWTTVRIRSLLAATTRSCATS